MTEKNKPALFSKEYQKEWSETHKYKHIHTGEYCTFEAYVAEFIVLRRADKLNLGKPGYKFWTKGDPNHWLWKKQLGAARQLKKKYSEEAVLKAINSKEFDKLLVLGIQNGRGYKINPLAEKVVASYHKKIEEQKLQSEKSETTEIKQKELDPINIRKTQYSSNKKSLNQLRNI
jgi:hypothetical protein